MAAAGLGSLTGNDVFLQGVGGGEGKGGSVLARPSVSYLATDIQEEITGKKGFILGPEKEEKKAKEIHRGCGIRYKLGF